MDDAAKGRSTRIAAALRTAHSNGAHLSGPIPIAARLCLQLLLAILLSACQSTSADSVTQAHPKPPQAGQPLDPAVVAGRLLTMRASAMTGNTRAIQAQQAAMQKDMMRSMRIPDPSRRIDSEAARAAVAPLDGVRGVVWLDRQNLMVMVGGTRYRSMQTIDRVCAALSPLGDTLAVVVNVQNMQAVTSEQADTLSRNCQLPQGQRAFGQTKLRVDALDPETRRVFEGQQGRRAE